MAGTASISNWFGHFSSVHGLLALRGTDSCFAAWSRYRLLCGRYRCWRALLCPTIGSKCTRTLYTKCRLVSWAWYPQGAPVHYQMYWCPLRVPGTCPSRVPGRLWHSSLRFLFLCFRFERYRHLFFNCAKLLLEDAAQDGDGTRVGRVHAKV